MYSNCVASSQGNHLDYAIGLCRFVAIDRSRSVAVIGFDLNHENNKLLPSNALCLKSTIDCGLGYCPRGFPIGFFPTLSPSLNGGRELQLPRFKVGKSVQ